MAQWDHIKPEKMCETKKEKHEQDVVCEYVMTIPDWMKNSTKCKKEMKIKATDKLKRSAWLLVEIQMNILLLLFFSLIFAAACVVVVIVHVSQQTYYPWLSFISIHCEFLCKMRLSEGLRSKCIAQYASLCVFFLSLLIYCDHWRCVLKSSVSIYVTNVDISLSLSSFIPLFSAPLAGQP